MRGIDPGSNLVIRTYAPARRRIVIGMLLVLGLAGLYVVYELGRYHAGYDRIAAASERSQLEKEIERTEAVNRELRTKLAELETIRMGQGRERAEVMRTIGELQAQVARQAQELAFYQGIVTEGATADPTKPGVKIQQLRIVSGESPTQFQVRLALARSARTDNLMTGTLMMKVEGVSGEEVTSLDLTQLSDRKRPELPFRFRYFESIEQSLTLPEGFQPERLTVEVRSSRKGVEPLTETFPWIVDAP